MDSDRVNANLNANLNAAGETVRESSAGEKEIQDSKSPPETVKPREKQGEYIALDLKKIEKEIDSLLIYTKAVKWPTLRQSLTEKRFILRVAQALLGLGMIMDNLCNG